MTVQHAIGWGLVGGSWAFLMLLFVHELGWWLSDRHEARKWDEAEYEEMRGCRIVSVPHDWDEEHWVS